MCIQNSKAIQFHALHRQGNPLVLYNIWDAGSAKAVEQAGAKAIGTSSWAVAEANGYGDGEALPVSDVVRVVKSIVRATDLPVTVDIESGYGADPDAVAKTAKEIIQAGAIGINLEDQVIGKARLFSIDDQVARIRACREVADQMDISVFINARTDIFLLAEMDDDMALLEKAALERAKAYSKAGANGFFAPGLADTDMIVRIHNRCPVPLNIMILACTPNIQELTNIGIPRISFGPGPYLEKMEDLKKGAENAIS